MGLPTLHSDVKTPISLYRSGVGDISKIEHIGNSKFKCIVKPTIDIEIVNDQNLSRTSSDKAFIQEMADIIHTMPDGGVVLGGHSHLK